jgi:hypothetical protein
MQPIESEYYIQKFIRQQTFTNDNKRLISAFNRSYETTNFPKQKSTPIRSAFLN